MRFQVLHMDYRYIVYDNELDRKVREYKNRRIANWLCNKLNKKYKQEEEMELKDKLEMIDAMKKLSQKQGD